MAGHKASSGRAKALVLLLGCIIAASCARREAPQAGGEEAAAQALPSAAPEIPGFLCVSPGAPEDGTSTERLGSPLNPLASLSAAIELSRTGGIREIRLAAGAFTETPSIGHSLRISGGWKADFSARSGKSALRAPQGAVLDPESPLPPAALTVRGMGIEVELQGMDICGAGEAYPAGLLLFDGARVSVSDCAVSGGGGAASFGLMVIHQARLELSDSRLSGGSGAESSALLLDDASASLFRSVLDAGSGTVASFGVQAYGSVLALHSSSVWGGSGDACQAVALSDCADVLLSRSSLSGGWGKASYALVSAWSSPTLEGCILSAPGTEKGWCVFENAGDSNPDMLSRCAFIPSKTGLYWDDNERAFNALDEEGNLTDGSKALTSPPSWGNLIWEGGSLVREPSAPEGAPAALRRADRGHEGSARDISGKERTEPWSMGAWEIDQ